MNFRSGIGFALIAGLALGGCAAGGAASGGPMTSPTGRTYEPGTEPTQTSQSRAATIAIATGAYNEALTEARAGIELDPTNPIHFFVAGEAAGGLQNYELADSMFDVAERIYPAYELETEPAREQIWADGFNLGVEAYNAGNTSEAVRHWGGAHLVYALRPEAAQNLAVLMTQEGDYDEAIRLYSEALENLDIEPATRVIEGDEVTERAEARDFMVENLAQLLLYTDQFAEAEALFRSQLENDPMDVEVRANLASAISRQGRAAEASEIYNELLNSPGLTASQLFNIGVSLFNAGEHQRASDAFSAVTEIQPMSRDAWYNQANALYAGEMWADLVPVAEELVEVDPLNENAALILARGYRETEQNQDALAALERIEELPIFMDELQLRPAGESTSVRGTATGNAAAQGTPVRVRFTFYNDDAQVGSETVTITAPAAEQSTQFEVEFQGAANAYSYEAL